MVVMQIRQAARRSGRGARDRQRGRRQGFDARHSAPRVWSRSIRPAGTTIGAATLNECRCFKKRVLLVVGCCGGIGIPTESRP